MTPATDFREARGRGWRVAWNDRFGRDVEALGWNGPGGFERMLAGEPVAAGRGHTLACELPEAGVTCLVRPVLHGGLFGGLLRSALRSPERAFAELRINAALHRAGAPVPIPALAAARRSGLAWNALVATVREDAAPDFLDWMATDPNAERISAAVAASGRAIRRFHDAGGTHADLHAKNVLVRERPDGGCEAIIVDLDGAGFGPAPSPARRMKELARLYRSILKRGLANRLGEEAHRRFLAAYVADDRALGAALSRHWPRERRRVALHELGYRNKANRPDP